METTKGHAVTFQTWQSIKQKYLHAIIFIRLGDHYYTYRDDAIFVSEAVGIEIRTHEQNEECAFPFQQLDNMLSKLVKLGKQVAVCDSLEKQ